MFERAMYGSIKAKIKTSQNKPANSTQISIPIKGFGSLKTKEFGINSKAAVKRKSVNYARSNQRSSTRK